MKAELLPLGTQVWTNDENAVWALGEVVHQENTMVTIAKKTGERLEIDLVSQASYSLSALAFIWPQSLTSRAGRSSIGRTAVFWFPETFWRKEAEMR